MPFLLTLLNIAKGNNQLSKEAFMPSSTLLSVLFPFCRTTTTLQDVYWILLGHYTLRFGAVK